MGRILTATDVVEVDVPADRAWALLEDATRNPTWQTGMDVCRWTSPPPVGVGSTYDQEAQFAGRTIRSTFKVLAHEPGRSITIRTTVSTFPIEVTRSVEALGEGRCRVTRVVQGEPGGLLGLFAGMAERRFRSQVTEDGARLVALLEGA